MVIYMTVIYVEKKTVAKSIAAALGAGEFRQKKNLTKQKLGILGYWAFNWNGEETYIIYGSGHLAALYQAKDYSSKFEVWSLENFPCIPQRFKTKPIANTIDFYNQALELFKKADLIVSATDSDREGQVVFDYLYKTTGVKTPWKRAWLPSDLTPNKIIQSFNNLEDWRVHYPLTLAGIVRSIADWTVGCNLTVASTLKYGGRTLMNEGRVQTTVLNMIVERIREIESFQPKTFWKIVSDIFFRNQDSFLAHPIEPEQFSVLEDAEAILKICQNAPNATVVGKEVKKRILKKPLLYNTTELQMAANKKFGYDVTTIAEEMEFLYNNHFITYPRTNAVVLSNALEKETKRNIKKLFSTEEYRGCFRAESSWSPFTSRHFDDYLIEKSEDSHTALALTSSIPIFSKLSIVQRNIYDLIALSIICLVYDDAEIEDTTLTIDIGGYLFKATGSTILNYSNSWLSIVKKEIDTKLPVINKGDKFPFRVYLSEGKTKPKPYFTQASILKAMTYADRLIDDEDVAAFMKSSECGLGTGGTRAEILGSLIKNRMIVVDQKHLIPTQKGYWLIDHIPNGLKMIKDPTTTGKWEQQLNVIATSDLETAKKLSAKFLARINDATRIYFRMIAESPTDLFSDSNAKRALNTNELSCPKCGSPLRKLAWGYKCCNTESNCLFTLGKFRGKQLTDRQMNDLLIKGKTSKITFTSKDNNKYQGFLTLDEKKEIVFHFVNSKKKEGKNHE